MEDKQKLSQSNKENSDLQNVRFEDLIIAKKNGKCAIFNKETSEFLTKHEFDKIILSKSGHHIAYRVNDKDEVINNNDNIFNHKIKISYSAIIDNYGNVKEFEDIVFGDYGEFNNDLCPALYKKTGKIHLVDYNKGIISDGFDDIVLIDNNAPLGIYTAFIYYNKDKPTRSIHLLFQDGNIIDVNIKSGSAIGQLYEIIEIDSLGKMLEFIKKYGANIIELTPYYLFTTIRSYNMILLTINKYHPHQLNYAIDYLKHQNVLLNNSILDGEIFNFNDEIDPNLYNTIMSNDIKTYKLNNNSFNFEISLDDLSLLDNIESENIKDNINRLYNLYKFLVTDIK